MENQEKRIPGFSRYVITPSGVVKNSLTTAIMTVDESFSRPRVKIIGDDGKRTWFYPSEKIAEIFAPVVEEVKVDHFKKETVPVDLVAESLSEVKTRVPKKYDFSSMPVDNKKKIHASNKITPADVQQIRKAYDLKQKTKKQIAAEYGLCWQTAGKICNRKIYKNVPDLPVT